MVASADTRVEQLRTSMSQSGLLFQEHPDVGGWRATRAGALSGEIAAYKNDEVDPAFDRLSIRYFEEGEEDDSYVHTQDTWYVEYMDTASHHHSDGEYKVYMWGEPDCFTDREAMLQHVAEVLLEVHENRPTTETDE